MLLTISTTHRPATALAGMLGQHPDAIRAVTFPFGHAMLCFSQADESRCSAAVMLQHPGRPARPSMLADALADLFEPARSVAGPTMRFEVASPVLPCPGGPERLWQLFGPLGYSVATAPVGRPGLGRPDGDGDGAGGGNAEEPAGGAGGATEPVDHPAELAVQLCAEVPLAGLLDDLCSRLPALDGVATRPSRPARSAPSGHR
jgi:hypothetical protein